MAYFSESQIAKAKEIDLLTYLQNYCPDELVYEARDTYHTQTHDSLKINNGLWYWFSRGIGGRNALEYLIQVEGYSFTDAVGHLLNQKGLEKKNKVLTKKETNHVFVLPPKSNDNYKVISYLSSRGISKNIINNCIDKNLIYQELGNNNVVFVGYDKENNAKYAGVRGTNSSRFMHDVYGSDKAYSFKLCSNNEKNSVHLFESAIDLLSYATLIEIKNGNYQDYNLLSLSGVYKPAKDIKMSKTPETLSNYLKNNSNIKKIFIHFDNDVAGREATKGVKNSLSDSYEIIDIPPKNGKDVNDFLCYYLKKVNIKCNENCR